MSNVVNVDFVTRAIVIESDGKENVAALATAADRAVNARKEIETVAGTNYQQVYNVCTRISGYANAAAANATTARQSAESAMQSKNTAETAAASISASEQVCTSSRNAVEASAASATQSAQAAAQSAQAAAQIVNVGVDPTLTVSGSAADSKVTGLNIENLKINNSFDIIGYLLRTNKTKSGLTYSWNNDGSCTVTGQVEGISFCNLYYNKTALAEPFIAGETYLFRLTGADKVVFQIITYDSTGKETNIDILNGYYVTIPSDAVGMLLRIAVMSKHIGETVKETVKPAAYFISEAINAGKFANLGLANGKINSYTDANDIDRNCVVVTSDANVLANTPYSIGWVFTIVGNWDAEYRFQIMYPYNVSNNIMYRVYSAKKMWSDWKEIQGGGVYNNTYQTNQYNNTYNVTATPEITTDTNNYLSATAGMTDRTNDIQSMLNATGVCHLGPGTFYITGVTIPANAELAGCGNKTILRLADSVVDGFAVKLSTLSNVHDLMIIGAETSPALTKNIGTRHGILWEGNYQNDTSDYPAYGMVSNMNIANFTGGGITCRNTGYPSNGGLNVVNGHITGCGAGINIFYWSEFHRFTNINSVLNYYGCINNGGNNVFVNCNFSANKQAFLMDNAQDQSPNNTHGSAIGCVFNHTDNNNGTAIKILNTINGYTFTGCQIFYGKIEIENTSGIVIADSVFGSGNTDISIKNGGAVLFANNMHGAFPNITVTNNNKVRFANCYVRDTGEIVTN